MPASVPPGDTGMAPYGKPPFRHSCQGSGFVVRRSDIVNRASTRGAAMLAVILLILVGTIAVTGLVHLTAARLQQTAELSTVVQRHQRWQNSLAVDRQYMFTWAMRDDVTRASVSGALTGGWGGASAEAFGHLRAFATSERASSATVSYPFNNIRPPGTTDGGVYFERTDGFTDSSQTEKLTFYNYLKSYPSTLLGDLFVIHKKAATAPGSYTISSSNFQVNGRVLIFDGTATTSGIRATSVMHGAHGLTNSVLNTAGTATVLPDNYAVRPYVMAGYGGAGAPYAVTDGSLNQVYNANFPAGSFRDIITNTGNWYTGSTNGNSATNLETDHDGSGNAAEIKVDIQHSPFIYPAPTTAPYAYTPVGDLNTVQFQMGSSTIRHLRIVSGVEQLVLLGQTSAATYTAAGLLPPVLISVEQGTMRDIRFIGENNRPFILALADGAGLELYMSFESSSVVGGSPCRWRMQLINENRALWLASKAGQGVLITGALRTNYQVNCADGNSSIRFTWQRDTEPDRLVPFLPRDGWLETYLVTQ
jgi:hypothetical protein